MPESSLPLTLPDITDFEPGPDGESPLARHKDWVKTTCPCCGGPATRETDTMPQWAGSSWYFLRYMDPHCKDALASKEALEYWSPVDWYNGGMEHTTLHLLYSRFWHKFLYDIGVVPTAEPYQKRTAHGMILGLNPHSFVNLPAEEQEKLLKEYGSQKAAEKALEEKYGEMARHPIVKMSKSLGNVINPDEVVDQYGADTMRLYEMFMGDFEQAAPWQTSAIAGCNRFLDRVWALSDKLVEGEGYRPAMETLMHQTIKKVSADIESLKMNTAIAQLMTLVNAMYDNGGATKAEFETLVQLLKPLRSPHDRGTVGEAGSQPRRAAGLLSVACLRGSQVCGGCCGDRRAGERQGEGTPEGARRHHRRGRHCHRQGRPRCGCRAGRQAAGQGNLRQGPSGQSGCQGLRTAAPLNKREHIITRRGGFSAGNTRERLFKNLSKSF